MENSRAGFSNFPHFIGRPAGQECIQRKEHTMKCTATRQIPEGIAPLHRKIPVAVHLAFILLLIAITTCNGPLAAYFA